GNLRGRALASYDAVVGPVGTVTGGVITPLDYLIGTRISDGGAPNLPGFETANFNSVYFIQPILFGCPGVAIYNGPSGVTFCGSGPQTQISEQAILGPIKTNVATLAGTSDPAPVGQGIASSLPALSGTCPGPTCIWKLFVGDQRPQQVIVREGL